MKISIIQSDIKWKDKKYNLSYFKNKIENINETDLIVLPEMFTTGFAMKPFSVAETMDGETINWMKSISTQKNFAICGSIIIKENEKYYNRLIWVEPNETIRFYDKRHLFSYSGEDEEYTKGTNKLIIDYKGFRICPLICYDLRFPVFSRNVDEYDVLIYVANWPSKRAYAWKNLLVARAIENQSYVIGVNRIGSDNSNYYMGNSMIIRPNGEIINNFLTYEKTLTFNLDKELIESIRTTFPFLKDKDNFKIID